MPSATPPTPRRPTRAHRLLVYALFLATSLVALCVPLYNRTEPALGGVPFFYWFQIMWIVVMAIMTAIAYWLDV
ncbi:MAG TPA: DUF3311 domain-containing protein [Gemmatimonadaceae bacterium]|nr:DUF3311 domain-containing protein [Gemmatimonadaceae bacterium]